MSRESIDPMFVAVSSLLVISCVCLAVLAVVGTVCLVIRMFA